MDKVRLGIIGLGEVAQVIHLPVLQTLPDYFEVVSVCDISEQLLQAVGDRFGVEKRHRRVDDMVVDPNVDAVVILSSDEYHTEAAIAALEQGKHVFIEKPMCLNTEDAEAIMEARNKSGKQVMVGYMRRFAPAYVEAAALVRQMQDVHYARVRDIIGHNHFFIEQSSHVVRPTDIGVSMARDKAERGKAMVHRAIGEVPGKLYDTYRLLCGLSSHDLSAMREIIGMPKAVHAAAAWDPNYLAVIFEYDGFYTTYETGIDSNRRFDAHIEVYGEDMSIKVQYDTPYIRHLPTTLHINSTTGDSYSESVVRPTFRDPYSHEWEHFYDVVTKGVTPKTTPEDYVMDLKLFSMIIEKLRRE